MGASRANRIRDRLRERIASGEWSLHSRIPSETALASEYGVGRGTIREAIRELTALGLVETAAGRGTFVRSRVPTDAALAPLFNERGPAECLQLRAAIEAEAARNLARTADEQVLHRVNPAYYGSGDRPAIPGEFHTRLVEAGCEPLLVSIYSTLLGRINAFLLSGRLRHALDREQRRAEHIAILDAIKSGDAALAAHLAAEHARGDLEPVEPGQ